MATIDLGRLGFVNKGTYNNSTTYEKNDLVQFTDGGILSTYLYIDSTAQSGQAPSSSGTAGSRWVYFAKGVADAVASAGNNKVLVRDGSGNLSPLSIGSAGQVVKVNSGANGFEFGSGFEGNYVLHAHDRYTYGSNKTMGSISVGNADDQKDCVVINGGAYNGGSNGCTFTPTHADDLFFITGGCNFFSNSNNGYSGLGFMSSTSTDFSANRNFPHYNGQHSQGNGSGTGDEYRRLELSMVMSASELNLTANTQYYFRLIAQKHDQNNAVYNQSVGTTTNSGRHQMTMVHWKKV